MSSPPVTVGQAAHIAGCHPETVRRALRTGELHGKQRTKSGTWKLRPGCVKKWAENEPCKHQIDSRPVSLDAFRQRRSAS
ncbi:helix-turn-helix domain-containing protein [Leucobacter sp. NPDC058333]|uniref:helix-turn-helix domain-containing protein n=1 Tax=Leucobacter sp. NPDC058333 TaxID=3346450 RepID=UPI00364799A3